MNTMPFEDYRTSHVGEESWAKDYDAKLFAPGSFDAAMWEREQLLIDRIVQQHVARKDSYLDFACGTGRVLSYAGRYFEEAVGLDISDTMLSVARERAPHATLVQADATHDPAALPQRPALAARRRDGFSRIDITRPQLAPALQRARQPLQHSCATGGQSDDYARAVRFDVGARKHRAGRTSRPRSGRVVWHRLL
jgi:SAM-dependent methyltransferase